MTTPPTEFSEETENDEPSGPLAEAFARLATAPASLAEAPSEPATVAEDVLSGDDAVDSASTDDVAIEVDEDSPFAAAAEILQTPAPEADGSADEAVVTEDAVEEVAVVAEEASEPDAETPASEVDASASEVDASASEVDAPADEAVATEDAVEEVAAVVEDASESAAKTAAPAKATPAPAEAAAEVEESEEEEPEEILPPASPYDLPGGWYVVHSYSGYENKVKANLGTRIKSMHMEDSIFDIVIPMEDVVEIKSGRKVTVPRKQFPGYILVRMYMDDDSWGVVRNTPGVTGFVGSGTKPTPMPRREVERILGVRKDEEKKAPRFKPDWEVGETVRVIDGPFADFNGIIEDINMDQSKVRVLVDIFGRETPVELNFEQIQKF